jgi:hypothetical protein
LSVRAAVSSSGTTAMCVTRSLFIVAVRNSGRSVRWCRSRAWTTCIR